MEVDDDQKDQLKKRMDLDQIDAGLSRSGTKKKRNLFLLGPGGDNLWRGLLWDLDSS